MNFTREELEILYNSLEYASAHHWAVEDELDVNINTDILDSLLRRMLRSLTDTRNNTGAP